MRAHLPFRATSLASAVVLLATSAQAQTDATTTLPPVEVKASADASAGGLKAPYAGGQVARGGRVGLLGSMDVMDTPFNITNYTQKLIQDTQAASIADVLQNDPAVRVARGFGNYQQLYIVRGLPVYSDDMAYNGLYGLLPRQYLAAELVERVEVLRGASAFLNGAAPGGSGLGGAINVSPKRAPNEPLTEITVGVESGGQAYVAADVARRFGPDDSTGIRINAVGRDGHTAVDGEKRELGLLSVGADFHTRDLRVSADLGYQNHRLKASMPSITIGGTLPIPSAPDASKQIAQPWSYSYERDTFGTVRAEYDLASNVTAWLAGGFREGRESASFANPTTSDAAGTDNLYRFDNVRRDSIATGELGVRAKLVTGPVGHTLVGSWSAYSAKSKNAYALSSFGLAAGTIYDTTFIAQPPANFFTGGVLDDPLLTARTKTSSLAIADVLSFMQDSVLLTVGARRQTIESYSYDYDSGVQSPGAYSASRITPVAGLVFKASRQVSLYATYIEGLVAGDIAPATSGSTVVTNAGEVFKPYQSKQVEAGVKVDTGRFGGTLSVFRTRKPVASVDASGHYGINDEQSNKGVELSVYGEPARGVRLLGGATYLHTDVSGKAAIGAPRTQVNLGAEADVPGVAGLAVNVLGVHTSTQYADAANTQEVPAWSRLDAGVRYAFTVAQREVTVRARVNNLTNRNYWASAGGYPGAGYLVVGEPRTFILSGTVAF